MDLVDIMLIAGGDLTDEELEEIITISETMEFIQEADTNQQEV